MGDAPPILKKKHNDWPWPFSLIPRGWNAFYLGRKAPVLMWGSELDVRTYKGFLDGFDVGPAPVPEYGAWQISRFPGLWFPFNWTPLYFALTTSKGWHYRAGLFRGDDVDGYYTFLTVARRHFPPGMERNTAS